MKALILAAGMGNRLGDLTGAKPKALINVAGAPLIDHVLSFINHPKVKEIGVVGGYQYELLKEHIKDKDINLFKNTNHKEGNIFSIIAAFDFINDDLLILNVDHIYPKSLLEHIFKNPKGICAMCDSDRELAGDDMKVKLTESGKLKKISKQLTDYDCGYIGMTFCGKNMTGIYKKAAEATLKIYGKSSCVEFVLGHLAANDTEINICDTSGYRWHEIDTPQDITETEEKLGKNEVK